MARSPEDDAKRLTSIFHQYDAKDAAGGRGTDGAAKEAFWKAIDAHLASGKDVRDLKIVVRESGPDDPGVLKRVLDDLADARKMRQALEQQIRELQMQAAKSQMREIDDKMRIHELELLLAEAKRIAAYPSGVRRAPPEVRKVTPRAQAPVQQSTQAYQPLTRMTGVGATFMLRLNEDKPLLTAARAAWGVQPDHRLRLLGRTWLSEYRGRGYTVVERTVGTVEYATITPPTGRKLFEPK